jgi:hypothetical protein
LSAALTSCRSGTCRRFSIDLLPASVRRRHAQRCPGSPAVLRAMDDGRPYVSQRIALELVNLCLDDLWQDEAGGWWRCVRMGKGRKDRLVPGQGLAGHRRAQPGPQVGSGDLSVPHAPEPPHVHSAGLADRARVQDNRRSLELIGGCLVRCSGLQKLSRRHACLAPPRCFDTPGTGSRCRRQKACG